MHYQGRRWGGSMTYSANTTFQSYGVDFEISEKARQKFIDAVPNSHKTFLKELKWVCSSVVFENISFLVQLLIVSLVSLEHHVARTPRRSNTTLEHHARTPRSNTTLEHHARTPRSNTVHEEDTSFPPGKIICTWCSSSRISLRKIWVHQPTRHTGTHAGLNPTIASSKQLEALRRRDLFDRTIHPAHDKYLGRFEPFHGRQSVLPIPSDLKGKAVLVSGHHGCTFVKGDRYVMDVSGGVPSAHAHSLILPERVVKAAVTM